MDNKILTPLQIWQDYDPCSAPLQISFTDFCKSGDTAVFEAFFNGDTFTDGSPRIFVSGKIPLTAGAKIVIYIKDRTGKSAPKNYENAFTERGFGFVNFDYCAANDDVTKRTKFPSSLSYGTYPTSEGHLGTADPDAKSSCQYLWTTITRRVITLVKTLSKNCRIILAGARDGADMMWQAAAMDKRVDAVIAINNAGWREYHEIFKYDEDAEMLQMTDERERWFAGCANQTYAKFVKCPCLCVCGSNNPITSLDRMENTLSFVENDRVYLCVSPNTGLLLPQYSLNTQLLFAQYFDNKAVRIHPCPTCQLSIKDDTLVADIEIDAPLAAKEITVCYAYNESDSTIRNWNRIILPQNGCKHCEIPVAENADCVFAFVNVEYEDKAVLSSYEAYIRIPQGVKRVLTRRTHIIYERKNGVGCFVADNASHYLACTSPYLKAGAYDILGITCDDADITTYAVGEDRYLREDESLLQFDAYSDSECRLEVKICNKEKGKKVYYTAVCTVNGDGEWTKCSLEPSSFKTPALVPLKNWNSIKSLTFRKVKGILLKNILWV